MGKMKDYSHSDCLLSSIQKLYESKTLCDVTLRAIDGCETKAHWLILAAHSEYFHSLCTSRDSDTISLAADSETMKNILEYLYTGVVEITESNRKTLIDTGQLLLMDSFVRFITEKHNSCNEMSVTNIPQGSSNQTSRIMNTDFPESVFMPEVHHPEEIEQFDINRVKTEFSEEDPVSTNLQVSFSPTSGAADVGASLQSTAHQFMSDHVKQLDAPVQIRHVVQNIARNQDESIPSSQDPHSLSCSLPGEDGPDVDIDNVNGQSRKKKKTTAAGPEIIRSARRGQSGQSSKSQYQSRTGRKKSMDVTLTLSRPKRSKIVTKGSSKSSSVKSELDASVDDREQHSKGLDMAVSDEKSDLDENSGEDMEESGEEFIQPRLDLEERVPPLPEASCSGSEEEEISPSIKRKWRNPNKAKKKRLRGGNFLTRWNRTSICSLCGFEGQIYAVVLHKKSRHPDDAHVCPLCFNVSADYSAMVQHLKRQHLWRESGKYQCPKCGRDCHNRVGMLSHDQIVHGIKHDEVLVCRMDGCNFYCASQSPATMEEHMKGHGDTFDYACDRCDKQYKTKNEILVNEETTALDESMLELFVVETESSVPAASNGPLNKPKLVITKMTNDLYMCSECDFQCERKYNLVRHFRKHTGEQYTCDQCNRKFVEYYGLKTHGCVFKEKRFMCDICAKTFHSEQGLREHGVRTHGAQGKYICSVCGKMFQNKSHFTNHVDMHYKRKQHKCNICGKAYGTVSNLNRHRRTCQRFVASPVDKRHHTCNVCQVVFGRKDELTDHIHGKHSTKKYHCPKCDKPFSWRASLWRHTRKC